MVRLLAGTDNTEFPSDNTDSTVCLFDGGYKNASYDKTNVISFLASNVYYCSDCVGLFTVTWNCM